MPPFAAADINPADVGRGRHVPFGVQFDAETELR